MFNNLVHFGGRAGRRRARLTVHNKYFDPKAAPEGRSALTIFLGSDYSFWKKCEENRPRYEGEKKRCVA